MVHVYTHRVTFGDCDPAGIVFYPNTFRWIDAAFHDFLRGFGGHASVCGQLGAVGLGLMDAASRFRSPLRDGDLLEVHVTLTDWGRKTLTVGHEGRVGDRVAFQATEVRGVFVQGPDGMTAADTDGLRAILAPGA